MRNVIALTLVLAALAVTAAPKNPQLPLPIPRLHLPYLEQAPTADGNIHEEEWAGAARLTGFSAYRQKVLFPAELQPVWWLGWDDDNLYFAQRFVLYPRGTIIAGTKEGDKGGSNPDAGPDMVFEDHVEIQIAKNMNREAILGDEFFKLTINPYGAIEDARRVHNVGWAGLEWESGATIGSQVSTDFWTLEVVLPFKSLGFDGPPADMTPLIMQLVSSADPEHFYSAWVPSPWLAWEHFPLVILDRNAPAVRIDTLGEPMGGDLDVRVSLRNGTDAVRQATVSLAVTDAADAEVVAESRKLAPAPGEAATATFEADDRGLEKPVETAWTEGYLRNTPVPRMRLEVSDDRGQTLFAETWRFTLRPDDLEDSFLKPFAARRKVASEPSVHTAYMPYFDKLEVHVDTDILGMDERYRRTAQVNVRLTPALWKHEQHLADRAGLVVIDETLPLPDNGVLAAVLDVPPLEIGQYMVATVLQDADGKALYTNKEWFRRYEYEWEHNAIGMTTEAIPPFEPITRRGSDLRLWNRQYRFGPTGLPEAMISDDADVLAGAPTLTATIDGQDVALEAAGKTAWTDVSSGLVIGETPNRLGSLAVGVRTRTEYDGMIFVDLTLTPEEPVTVQDMTLTVKLPPAVAREWFIMGPATDMYANVGGVPAEPGVFWDANRLRGTTNILGTFVPYLYMGDGERGICYTAASDRGRILDFESPASYLARTADSVDLILKLANTERRIDAPRTITFGLQGVPVKPLPDDYRRMGFGSAERQQQPTVRYRNGYGGSNGSCWGLGSGTDQWTMKDDLEYQILREEVLAAKRENPPNYDAVVTKYVPTNVLGLGNLGWETYGGEWAGYTEVKPHPHPGYNKLETPWGPLDPAGGTRQYCDLTQSSVDFRVWAFDQLQKRCGLNGLWWDHNQFWSSGSLTKGTAYVTDDGRQQGTLNIFLFRQLMKRLAVVSYLNAIPFRMGQYAPGIMTTMSFGTYNWAIEGPWYPQPGKSLLAEFDNSLQTFRTLSGRWSGLPTIAATRIHGNPEPEVLRMQARSCTGLCLLHDIPQSTLAIPLDMRRTLHPLLDSFGWFDKRTEWIPYWRSGDLVGGTTAKVVATVYRNDWDYGGPRALIVVFNAGDADATATLTFTDAVLGQPAKTVTDGEADAPVTGPLTIAPQDYRLLVVQ